MNSELISTAEARSAIDAALESGAHLEEELAFGLSQLAQNVSDKDVKAALLNVAKYFDGLVA